MHWRFKNSFPLFQMSRFILVGGLCYGCSLFIQWMLTNSAHLHYIFSYLIALGFTSILNWGLNRRFTFKSSDAQRAKEALRHQSVNLPAAFISLLLYALLVTGVGVNYLAANVMVAAIMTIFNFFIQRLFVFRN